MKNKRVLVIIGIVSTMLLIPLIAMQFTDEVNWTLTDFVVAGVLLFGIGLLISVTLTKLRDSKYKGVILFAIIILFLLIWAELAVGIFGSPFAGS